MPRAARETTGGRTFLEPASSALALGQHAVFGLDQLRELGLTSSAVRERARASRLHRIHHAVYSLVPRDLLKREGLYMAAVLALRTGRGPLAPLGRPPARTAQLRLHTD